MRLTCLIEGKSFKKSAPFFVPSHHNLNIVCCEMIKKNKNTQKKPKTKTRKIGNRGDSVGGKWKGMSGGPQRQQRSHFHSGVWFLFIYFFHSVSSYIPFEVGVGESFALASPTDSRRSAMILYSIPFRGPLSLHHLCPFFQQGAHIHIHTRECNYMTEQTHTHTVHFHPGSIADSILCKAGTEVQVGRGEWRGGIFPEGVSWYVIVLVSTQ